ncbi:MAG: amidase [Burkholderiales bacterium]|nr:amidase [Burkholderiales bacterium]
MHEFIKWTATEAVAHLRSGEVSPLDLIAAAERRIADTNPRINAMVTLCFERARDHARRLMNGPRDGRPAGFLHGLPIAVKDNTDVGGVRCTSGSRVFENRIAPGSDPVVQRLEAHGAIVIGKTNLPEFAAGGNTFNDVFGATRNPWDVRMSASGSSGGSAAALAAGQVWMATGNDFGGSIRTPAAFCSVAGLRPGPGMVARLQKQPFNPLSVEGPMARTVADVALMFDAEAGFDARDPLSPPLLSSTLLPSFAQCAAQPRKPRRVAVSADLGVAPVVDRELRAMIGAVADKLAGEGVVVEEAHPDLRDAARHFLTLRGAVYIARIAPLLAGNRHLLKPEVIENTEFGLGLKLADVVAAEIAQGEIIRRAAAFFADHDLLLCPAALCPPFPVELRYPESWDGVAFDGYMGWLALTCAVTMTACPVLALPGGFTGGGLPLGLQAIGGPRGEAALFSHGAWLEALLGHAGATPLDPR